MMLTKYRYGFNGKENDDETSTQDYGLRIYNPALGRFLSVDPLTASYPYKTPYDFAENRPIQGIDLDGGEFLDKTKSYISFGYYYGGIILKSQNFTETEKQVWHNINMNHANWTELSMGASPLIQGIHAYVRKPMVAKAPNDNDANDVETSSTTAQTNVINSPYEQEASGKGINSKTKYRNGKISPYQNTGPGKAATMSKSANFIMAAISLWAYVDETTNSLAWANVQQTSWQQSKLAARVLEVFNAANKAGLVDENYQGGQGAYNVWNYMLQGEDGGDANAKELALKLMKIYGIPIQADPPAAGTNSTPTSATTFGTTPTSSTPATVEKKITKANN